MHDKPHRASVLALTLVACLATLASGLEGRAHAFTTRVHIVLANELRQQLIESDDGTVALAFGDHRVKLSAQDAAAIIEHPLAFRAGAIGPDNFVFPAMTDASHAIHTRPYDQCEQLYQLVVTAEERAYAMGCFLHGATDAVAHHFVNYFSGETFTLTPISAQRQDSWDNVVRHIVTESVIQSALKAADQDRFAADKMLHTIPRGFVLRAYVSEESPLWQHMSREARGKLELARAARPNDSLGAQISAAGLSSAEQLVLLPVYLREVEALVDGLRAQIEAEITAMQADAELGVSAGDDGALGTYDDDTDCAATCPKLYATYFTYVGLLAPRFDAGGRQLPAAFEVVADKLRADLYDFLPAYIETIERVSVLLNGPLSDQSDGFDLTRADLDHVFAPMRSWVANITTIDYQVLVSSVVPAWLQRLDSLLVSVNVSVDIPNLLRIAFQPVIDEVESTIEERVIGVARTYLEDFLDQYHAQADVVEAEIKARFSATAPAELEGTALDHINESGMWGYAGNIAAATLAQHQVVLPEGDDFGGFGPATFDSSYTLSWMQAGVCGYLRDAIFPMGTDMRALLSVKTATREFTATVSDDSPVECHDGSLAGFAAMPSASSCALVALPQLVQTSAGSLSRAYPPSAVNREVGCRNLVVPGLPAPPAPPDAGPGGGESDAGNESDGGNGATGEGEGGGGCCSAGMGGGGGSLGLVLLVALCLVGRRFAQRAALLGLIAAAGLVPACGGGGGGGDNGGADARTAAIDSGVAPDAEPMGGNPDAGARDPDARGGSARAALLTALAKTVWHGSQTRAGVERAYELEFRADSLLWGELQNPYGPARHREMRSFTVDADGTGVHTTVLVPGGWPSNPANGRKDDWTISVIEDSNPRQLMLVRDGVTELYDEGPWPAPTTGLTAIVYSFPPSGAIDGAFCNSGSGGFDYPLLFAGARGSSGETLLGTDVVAGAKLQSWKGGAAFGVTDVEGFERWGGSKLSSQSNFVVRYLGDLSHTGGTLSLREKDDSIEDGLWVFIGADVGSDSTADLFLEVHGFAWADLTDDVASVNALSSDIPLEAILYRCTEPVEAVDLQVKMGSSGYRLLGDAPSKPVINDELFPPLF